MIFNRLQMPLTVLCGLSLLLIYLSQIPGAPLGQHHFYAFAAIAFGSVFALRAGWNAIKDRRLDVNLLMLLAGIGAIVVQHYEDAAVLLFLFSLSSALESMAMAKTESAIEALVSLRPSKAIRVGEGGDQEIPVESVNVGDTIRILPFENVPTDGELLSASASVNEASMTGESVPVEKLEGERLIAGTQNLDRMMLMRATSTVSDSTLEKIVGLVQEAQENKASGERISVWFGATYTVFVLAAFTISLIVRYQITKDWGNTLYNSLILLVALSPCALVISSPAAALSALAYAARRGILVRGGQYLEEAGRVDIVAMDKTGTLTEGKPKVVEVCVGLAPVAAGGHECNEACAACGCIACWHGDSPVTPLVEKVLSATAAVEAFSTHPIADSIVNFTKGLGISIAEVHNHVVVPGMGVEADMSSQHIKVGQAKFFEGELPAAFQQHVAEMRTRGLTAVLVNDGTQWAAIGLRDEPRKNAKELVAQLKAAGVKKVVMLTGDNPETANSIAEQLGISEVHAGLMPEDKKRILEDYAKAGHSVMMVGDGVNDSPALTQANIGIAMGGLGSEVALRSADVVLVHDRVELLPHLLRLGKKTNGIIRGNLIFAAGIIVMLVIGSFFGKVPLPLAVIGHEGSTALVVLNGLRLLRGPGN